MPDIAYFFINNQVWLLNNSISSKVTCGKTELEDIDEVEENQVGYQSKNWLQQPNIQPYRAAGVVILWITLLLVLDASQLGKDLENRVSDPLFFRIRDRLGLSPEIDPKIKVFAIDDSTVAMLGSPDPTIRQWSDLLTSIARKKPKFIVIDQMFTVANIPKGEEAAGREAIRAIENLDIPVIVGCFFTPRPIKLRVPLDLSDDNYSLEKLIRNSQNKEFSAELLRELPVKSVGEAYIYGPDPNLRKAFKNIGHIIYNGSGKTTPFYLLKNQKVLPHFMVLTQNDRVFHNGDLYINQKKVPMYSDGETPLNFSPYEKYLKHTRPLKQNLFLTSIGEDVKGVNEGDYVFIIPPFYTGHVDFHLTPFGIMPGGYVHLAFLNSIITNKWLTPSIGKELYVLATSAIGAMITIYFGPLGIAVSLILGAFLWTAFTVYLFAYHSFIIPWIIPMLGFIMTITTIFMEKARVAEKKSRFIKNALDGMIDPVKLDKLLKHPERINLDAKERVLSIMFIDVVGFSLKVENQIPRIAFDNLKVILSDMADIIYKHGGIINKNLGDGLLCLFGYSLDTDQSSVDHAEKAVECAIEIQKDNLPKTLIAYERDDPVYPLRIGINTSSVYMGNLGTENNIDFTVVGNGVNFAKRLEGNCKPHSIMIGLTTKELISPPGTDHKDVRKQMIQIKHHEEMATAFELNPFADNPDLITKAIAAHNASTNQIRREERWIIDESVNLIVQTNIGSATLLSFSLTGFSICLLTQVMPGATLRIKLDSKDERLGRTLKGHGIEFITTEVLWSYSDNGSFPHGVKFKNVSLEQAKVLQDELKSLALSDIEKPVLKGA